MIVRKPEYHAKAPHAALEQALIQEYLHSKGYAQADLKHLPSHQARRLMTAACQYASLKMAEIESRVGFRHKIQHE
ncbi:MAG: hypothetical protein JW862_03590 [Anaerolineales bacterium]|nr:hypothetical protein [Anaerolineales bacterium]